MLSTFVCRDEIQNEQRKQAFLYAGSNGKHGMIDELETQQTQGEGQDSSPPLLIPFNSSLEHIWHSNRS